MAEREKKWHWICRQNQYDFADDNTHFGLVHYTHRPAEKLEMHKHNFVELVYIINGKATHVFKTGESTEYRCVVERGDIFVINPGETHTYLFDQNESLELLNIDFDPLLVDIDSFADSEEVRMMDFLYYQPRLPLEMRFGNILRLDEAGGEAVLDIIRLMVSEFAQQKSGYKIIVRMGLIQVLTLLSRKYIELTDKGLIETSNSVTNYPNILRVRGYIDHHFTENLTKEQLAKIGMCSVRHLSRKFKELLGETVMEYIQKLRINYAKQLMTETPQKITDIALESGFQDISYFNKVFKTSAGMTPYEYRNQFNQKDF